MATTTVTGGAVKNNSGKIINAGQVAGSLFGNLSQISNLTAIRKFTKTFAGDEGAIYPPFVGSSGALGGIAQSTTTGFAKLTKSTHGWSVGDILVVTGSDTAAYNRTHVVTVVLSANTVQTNVRYTADTVSHGNVALKARNFNTMVKRQFVGKVIGSFIAGTADSTLRKPGCDFGLFRPFGTSVGYRRYNITGWSYTTGRATYGGSRGAQVNFHDIAGNNDNLAFEPIPTRAIPGELVYTTGKSLPVQDDYKPKTQ